MRTLGSHREGIIQIIVESYDLFSFDQFLKNTLGQDRTTIILAPRNFPELIAEVLVAAERQGWIEELLVRLKVDRPLRPDLGELVDRVMKDWGATPLAPIDPYQLFFTSRGVFVDRERSRAVLRDMHEPARGRFLVLRGGAKTGKTYTWHFLKAVANRRGFPAIYVDLVKWQGGTAAMIVESMAAQLAHGLRGEFDNYAREPRRTAQLAEWFADAVRKHDHRCWIFFDHLGKVALSSEVKNLLLQFVRVADEDLADLRIILADLPEEEEEERDFLEFSPLVESLPGVRREDIAQFLRTVATQLKYQIEEQTVNDVLDKIYPADGTPVAPRDLNARLVTVTRELFPELAP